MAWALMSLALPVFAKEVIRNALPVVSVALVGRLESETDLAAIGLATVFCNIVGYALVGGMATGIGTFSARAYGAKQYTAVGVIAQRAFFIILLTVTVPMSAMFFYSDVMLIKLQQPPAVCALVRNYAVLRIPGLFFQTLQVVIVGTFFAIKQTRQVMYAMVLSSIVGLGATFAFIVHLDMGLDGAALGFTVQNAVNVFLMVIFAMRSRHFRKIWGGVTREAFQGWGGYLKVAVPSCLLCCIEWWSWEAITFMSGYISTLDLGIQSVLINVLAIGYITPGGLQTACQSLVGNHLGNNDPEMAKSTTYLAIKVTVGSALVQCAAIYFLRGNVSPLFSPSPGIQRGVEDLTLVAMLFGFIDCSQYILSAVIIACGLQGKVTAYILAAYWLVGLPLGGFMAYQLDFGLYGIWYGMLIAVTIHFCTYAFVTARLDWPEQARAAVAQARKTVADGDDGGDDASASDFASANRREPLLAFAEDSDSGSDSA
jgi:MATE family multidrug resistance protein